jgi:hypothetical protein
VAAARGQAGAELRGAGAAIEGAAAGGRPPWRLLAAADAAPPLTTARAARQ